MSKLILSIDPGQTGALVWRQLDEIVEVLDMPTIAKLTGKGETINAAEVAGMIGRRKPDVCYIEKVHAMPKQGSTSTFEFGYGVGILHGVMASFQVPYKLITPQSWKKHLSLINKEKDAARSLAIANHPKVAHLLTRVKDGGRADAICIGDYAYYLEKD